MDVLRHRVLTTYEAEAAEVKAEDLIQQIFEHLPVPRMALMVIMLSPELLKRVRSIHLRTVVWCTICLLGIS